MSIALTLTDAGDAAILTHINAGTSMQLSYIRVGQGHYTPTGQETDLTTPFDPDKKFNVGSVESISGNLEFTFEDVSTEAYSFSEIGVFDDNDALIFVGSHISNDLGSKISNVDQQWIVLIAISAQAASSITFNTTVPVPATETRSGLVRLATNKEGTDGTVSAVITASVLKHVIDNLPAASPATQTAAQIRDALAGLSGANRLGASAIKDLPAPGDPDQTPAEIRDALQTLSGTNRLAASAIKDLPAAGDPDQTPAEIRDALQTLSGNNRLAHTSIKGLGSGAEVDLHVGTGDSPPSSWTNGDFYFKRES